MAERRYSDDEVAAIFARATEVQQSAPRQLAPAEGMSLTELQAIGREAGIAPELVAEAARAMDRPPPPKPPTFLGLPLGVSHSVELGRKVSDAEWEHLVVELRETFNARGRVHIEGSLRSWTNGNLQILVEPSGDGDRVRMSTIRQDARGLMTAGLAMVGISVATGIATIATIGAGLATELSGIWGMGLVGGVLFSVGALRLPRWARTRREQMQRLAAKLLSRG